MIIPQSDFHLTNCTTLLCFRVVLQHLQASHLTLQHGLPSAQGPLPVSSRCFTLSSAAVTSYVRDLGTAFLSPEQAFPDFWWTQLYSSVSILLPKAHPDPTITTPTCQSHRSLSLYLVCCTIVYVCLFYITESFFETKGRKKKCFVCWSAFDLMIWVIGKQGWMFPEWFTVARTTMFLHSKRQSYAGLITGITRPSWKSTQNVNS
jgi:hypothetical protein